MKACFAGASQNMKFSISLAAFLVLSACGLSFCKAADESTGAVYPVRAYFPGRVNVVFSEGISPECARSIVAAHSMTVLREHEALFKHSRQVFFHLISDTLTSDEMVRRLENDPRVHTVKEESTRSIPGPHRPGIE